MTRARKVFLISILGMALLNIFVSRKPFRDHHEHGHQETYSLEPTTNVMRGASGAGGIAGEADVTLPFLTVSGSGYVPNRKTPLYFPAVFFVPGVTE